MLLGIFIFFVLIFFMIVGCTLCLLWLRKKDEDQQVILNSGLTPKDFEDEEEDSCGHNDQVFEMEVFNVDESKDETADFPAQFV